MAIWIKGSATGDCDCPDCGTTPCDAGCACTFSEGGFETEVSDFEYNFDVTGQFGVEREISIEVGWGDCNIPPFTARFRVLADGVIIYDSGCQASFSVVTTATVPAGTTEITVAFIACTSPGSDCVGWNVGCVP